MNILYSGEIKGIKSPSVFLAGPSPRSKDVESWRPAAIEKFSKLNFDGTIFVPEYREGALDDGMLNWSGQIHWEQYCLDAATIIMMWVPRDLDIMPAFTTNIEFGLYVKSGRLRYGRPSGSPKNEYLDYCYKKFSKEKDIHDDLGNLVYKCAHDAFWQTESAGFQA